MLCVYLIQNKRIAIDCSRRDALWIAWEHRCLADVVQAEVQHDDTLHANAATSVWWTTKPEGFDVCGDFRCVDGMVFRAFGKELGVVDTLCAGQNFLATHEHVVGVGPFL